MDTLKFPSPMSEDKDEGVVRALESLAGQVADTHRALKTLTVKPANGNGRKLVTLQNLVFTILISVIGFLLITQVNQGERLARVEETRFTDTMGEQLRADMIRAIRETEDRILDKLDGGEGGGGA